LREDVLALKSKVLHPREALKAKLIDNITTFEEFTSLNYPNHNVEDVVYRLDGTRLRSTLTQQELSALETFFEVIEMPNVALLSSEDLLLSSVKEIIDLLHIRLESNSSLDEFDLFLGDLFDRLEGKVSQGALLF
jgi:hypothetical protein